MKNSSLRRLSWTKRWRHLTERPEAGMTTAEYAIGTVAACAFAGLLLLIIQSGVVEGLVTTVITTALTIST